VLAFSDIIDFLLRLMGDETTQAQFDQDPQGTLQQAGLEGVTAQDIRDARLQLADSGAVHATDEDALGARYSGPDAVHEIGYTRTHYVADEGAHHATVDHGSTLVTIDDRDTLFFQSISDDDVTVTDNSVAITDSFNQDNSDDDLTAIQDNSVDTTTINADDSFNTSDDDVQVAIQDNDVNSGDETTVVDVDGTGVPPDVAEPQTGEPEAADADPAAAEPPVDLGDGGPVDDPDPADDPADDLIDDPAADDAAVV
jgi:hypothetical protein